MEYRLWLQQKAILEPYKKYEKKRKNFAKTIKCDLRMHVYIFIIITMTPEIR